MTDLLVDFVELQGTATELTDIATETHASADSTGALQGLAGAAGHGALVSAGEDFLGKWKYGLGKVGEDAQSLVKMLESSVAAFTDVDTQLGDAAPEVGVQFVPDGAAP